MSTDQRLKAVRSKLGHVDPVRPSGLLFESYRQVDDVLYLSGELPFIGSELPVEFRGSVGRDVTIENASKAAEIATLNLLTSAQAAIGSLDNIDRMIEAFGYISSSDSFFDQSTVMNACSSILLDVFGEDRGQHTRGAIGVYCLPLKSCVEIKMILHLDCVGIASSVRTLRGTK
tara:strand:- start:28113 stop:28634 length:522 start_codon:yes stop_codon:yes gene_type:complete